MLFRTTRKTAFNNKKGIFFNVPALRRWDIEKNKQKSNGSKLTVVRRLLILHCIYAPNTYCFFLHDFFQEPMFDVQILRDAGTLQKTWQKYSEDPICFGLAHCFTLHICTISLHFFLLMVIAWNITNTYNLLADF